MIIDRPVRFANFVVLSRLGSGGMGEVYRAVKIGTGGFEKDVALKIINPDISSDSEFRRLFLREARIAAKIQHPSVVQVYELGMARGTLYMSMELVKGVTLRKLINVLRERDEKLGDEEAAFVLYSVATALSAVHNLRDGVSGVQKVIHRDVSPQNIFVSYVGGVKLGDFGVAKVVGYTDVTRPGEVKGKLGYMAPEQLHGEDVDERTDIFSLGVVMVEVLTGRKPFPMAEITSGGSVVREFDAGCLEVRPAFTSILARMLCEEKAERYSSASVLAETVAAGFDVLKGQENLLRRMDRLFASERENTEKHVQSLMCSREFARCRREILKAEGGERTIVQGGHKKNFFAYGGAVLGAFAVAALLVGYVLILKNDFTARVIQEPARPSKSLKVLQKERGARGSARTSGHLKESELSARRRGTRSNSKPGKYVPLKKPAVAYISVRSEPDGYVFVDGKNTGVKTPVQRLTLKPGDHTIAVVNPERGIIGMERVTLKKGGLKIFRFYLRKEKQKIQEGDNE